MAEWRRCDRCRRVLPAAEFDGDSTTCRDCLATPVKAPRTPTTRASGVTTKRKPPADPTPEGPRPVLRGVAGSGDLEMRERRARRLALDSLAETYAEDFEHLLQQARRDEGLRS